MLLRERDVEANGKGSRLLCLSLKTLDCNLRVLFGHHAAEWVLGNAVYTNYFSFYLSITKWLPTNCFTCNALYANWPIEESRRHSLWSGLLRELNQGSFSYRYSVQAQLCQQKDSCYSPYQHGWLHRLGWLEDIISLPFSELMPLEFHSIYFRLWIFHDHSLNSWNEMGSPSTSVLIKTSFHCNHYNVAAEKEWPLLHRV